MDKELEERDSKKNILFIALIIFLVILTGASLYYTRQAKSEAEKLRQQLSELQKENESLQEEFTETKKDRDNLKKELETLKKRKAEAAKKAAAPKKAPAPKAKATPKKTSRKKAAGAEAGSTASGERTDIKTLPK